MEIPVRRIAAGYFKISSKDPNRDFSLLIPAPWGMAWTCSRLKQLFGTELPIKLKYMPKRTNAAIGQGSAIQLL